jgi:hypothetical protein
MCLRVSSPGTTIAVGEILMANPGVNATQPGFADEEDIMMRPDPLAGGQGTQKLAIQSARVLIINVLHHATFFEFGQLQAPGQRTPFFPGPLAIDQQTETFFEAELAGVGHLDLFPECVRHAMQLHGLYNCSDVNLLLRQP